MLGGRLRTFAARSWQRLLPAPRESGPAGPELRDAVTATLPLLERIRANLVSFWYPRCIDDLAGGYLLHHDGAGNYKGPIPKRTLAQARTLWYFARLARSGRGPPESLDAARHGFEFLAARMWDSEQSGFFWETDAEGSQPTVSHKYLLAHTFSLYAISEYALASGDTRAVRLASETFQVMEHRFHDPEFGGYWTRFTADWRSDTLPPELTRSPAGLKTVDGHLHALEAVTSYVELSADPLARTRLQELLEIQTHRVFRERYGCCTDAHRADWTPLLDRVHAWCDYGHDLEAISLVLAACEVAGVPAECQLGFFRALFRNALRWGYDRRHGGFYKSGPIGAPAYDRSKSWWVQAESLQAALEMFRLTGDAVYARCYLATLEWIAAEQVDWEYGEWHLLPRARGTPLADKAGPWKEPYHTGRAILRCLELSEGARERHESGAAGS